MATPKKKVTRTKKAPAKRTAAAKPVTTRSKHSYTGPREPHIPAGVTVVDEIPQVATANSRVYRFANRLAEMREELQPGQSAIVAEFIGKGGAGTVKRAIEAGKRPIDGELDDWEFTARRTTDGSILFATLVNK